MERPNSTKSSREPSPRHPRHKPSRVESTFSKKSIKAQESKHKRKRDLSKKRSSFSNNSSPRQSPRGGQNIKKTTGKPARTEKKPSKKEIHLHQTKQNTQKTKKEYYPTYNFDSPTQTKANNRTPIINTEILNYMVNSQVKGPIKDKKNTKKKFDNTPVKKQRWSSKKPVEIPDKKNKSKKLKIADTPPSSETSVKKLRWGHNVPPVEDTKIKNKSKSKTLYSTDNIDDYKSNFFKRKIRSGVWKLTKNSIRGNERLQELFAANRIDIDKINPEAINHNIINVDALGIENKLLKRTITWLLK